MKLKPAKPPASKFANRTASSTQWRFAMPLARCCKWVCANWWWFIFPKAALSGRAKGKIAGTAGAGDAFCAGVLLGLHEGWDLQRCLQTGVCVATASLSDPTCTGGIKLLKATLEIVRKYRFRPPLEPTE